MALTLEQASDLTNSTGFRGKVRSAIIRAAVNIHSETVDDEVSQQRVTFASQVARTPDNWLASFASAVAASESLNSITPDDSTIYNIVAGVWDVLAVGNKSIPDA